MSLLVAEMEWIWRMFVLSVARWATLRVMSWQSISVTIYYHSLTGLFRYFYKPLTSVHRFYIWRRSLMYHTLLFLKIHITILFAMVTGATLILIFFFLWMFYFSQFLIAIRTLFASIFSLVIENWKQGGNFVYRGTQWRAPAAYFLTIWVCS